MGNRLILAVFFCADVREDVADVELVQVSWRTLVDALISEQGICLLLDIDVLLLLLLLLLLVVAALRHIREVEPFGHYVFDFFLDLVFILLLLLLKVEFDARRNVRIFIELAFLLAGDKLVELQAELLVDHIFLQLFLLFVLSGQHLANFFLALVLLIDLLRDLLKVIGVLQGRILIDCILRDGLGDLHRRDLQLADAGLLLCRRADVRADASFAEYHLLCRRR